MAPRPHALDLRAVEQKVRGYYDSEGDDLDLACDVADTAVALLAALRATRAALQAGLDHMHPLTCDSMDGYEASGRPCDCWHAQGHAVLAQVRDGGP